MLKSCAVGALLTTCWLAGSTLARPVGEPQPESPPTAVGLSADEQAQVAKPKIKALPLACSPILISATRLLVVSTVDLTSANATARLYRRAKSTDRWTPAAGPWRVTIGKRGLGWAWDQRQLGKGAEPVKREGDGKTPAGIFAGGFPFGFQRLALKNYLRVKPRKTVCVDDVRSPLYNRIATLGELAPGHSHEKMWRIRLYRLGMTVRHRTNSKVRGGSCIFLHVWRGPGRPTVGCVAMPQAHLRRVLAAFDGQRTAIAILPRRAFGTLAHCGLPLASRH